MSTKLVSPDSKLLDCSALLSLLGKKSRQFVYDLMRRDQTFPRPITLASQFSIAWHRSEVEAWLDARPRATLDGMSAVERRQQGQSKGASPNSAKPKPTKGRQQSKRAAT